jgi:hypothetical protein
MPESDSKKREIQISNAELFPHIIALLEEGHTVNLKLRGFSMRPFLEDKRDTAVMKKAEEAVCGEPVLAEIAPGRYVLHRIIEIDGDNITLLGDGNLTVEHCQKSDIKAQIVGFYRKGRTTMDTLQGRKWRTYSRVWMFLRPIRRYLLGIYRRWVKVFGPM